MMPIDRNHPSAQGRLAPDVPAEEGVDLADAEEQVAVEPEEKKNLTDGADGT